MLKNYRTWDKLIAAFLFIHIFRVLFNPYIGLSKSIEFLIYSPLRIFETFIPTVAVFYNTLFIASVLLYLVVIVCLLLNKHTRNLAAGIVLIFLSLFIAERFVSPIHGNLEYLTADAREQYLEHIEIMKNESYFEEHTDEKLDSQECEDQEFMLNIEDPDSEMDSDDDGIPDRIEYYSDCDTETKTVIYPSFFVTSLLYLVFIYLLFIRPKHRRSQFG